MILLRVITIAISGVIIFAVIHYSNKFNESEEAKRLADIKTLVCALPPSDNTNNWTRVRRQVNGNTHMGRAGTFGVDLNGNKFEYGIGVSCWYEYE